MDFLLDESSILNTSEFEMVWVSLDALLISSFLFPKMLLLRLLVSFKVLSSIEVVRGSYG